MKGKAILILIAVFLVCIPFKIKAQVNVQDSLALVDFYNSTDGPNWTFVQWDLNSPVKYWGGITVTNNRVTGMEFRGLFGSGIIPSSFGNLTALTSIYFLDCRLDGPLPESFGNLINLTSLKLSAAFYTPQTFPSFLNKLTNLTMLDLSVNHFSDTQPIYLGDLKNLKSLDLSYTTIGGGIPLGLENLKVLNGLALNSSNLSGAIPESIGEMTSLSSLDLTGNHLSGSIPASINSLINLAYFYLFDNDFTFEGIEPFVQNYNDNNRVFDFQYSPQSNIEINQHHDKLAVSAGGTLANNTYKWYKGGIGLQATIAGDSTFTPQSLGEYYVEISNSTVNGLTLTSKNKLVNILLEDATTTVLQNVAGTDTTYFNDGFFKILSLKPIEGTNALNGDVTATVTIDQTVPTFNSQPYVQRHFDITPAVNESNAQAIVTLYFTQQEFVNYNNYVITNNLSLPLLPTESVDNGNVRITQYHGAFTGSSQPGNYSGDEVLIIPSVKWNPVNAWWVVTFPVSGFSGFYLSTANSVLPLTLLNFAGKKENKSVMLQWQTCDEINTKQFIVQQKMGGAFNDIGNVTSRSTKGIHNYNFKHQNPAAGNNLYRLKMEDIDSKISYSNIIKINFSGPALSLKVYPNPAASLINLKIVSAKAQNILLRITDVSGKIIYQKTISVNAGINSNSVNIEKLPSGFYHLNMEVSGRSEQVSFMKE